MTARRSFLALVAALPVVAVPTSMPAATASPRDIQAVRAIEKAQAAAQALVKRQLAQYNAQLSAITGGDDVVHFIAASNRQAVTELREIRRMVT